MIVYLDRAFCVRSLKSARIPCGNESCVRFVTDAHEKAAEKKGLHFDIHDLFTSKCGFVPREGE